MTLALLFKLKDVKKISKIKCPDYMNSSYCNNKQPQKEKRHAQNETCTHYLNLTLDNLAVYFWSVCDAGEQQTDLYNNNLEEKVCKQQMNLGLWARTRNR